MPIVSEWDRTKLHVVMDKRRTKNWYFKKWLCVVFSLACWVVFQSKFESFCVVFFFSVSFDWVTFVGYSGVRRKVVLSAKSKIRKIKLWGRSFVYVYATVYAESLTNPIYVLFIGMGLVSYMWSRISWIQFLWI